MTLEVDTARLSAAGPLIRARSPAYQSSRVAAHRGDRTEDGVDPVRRGSALWGLARRATTPMAP